MKLLRKCQGIFALSIFSFAAAAATVAPPCSFLTLAPDTRPIAPSEMAETLRVARLSPRELSQYLKSEPLDKIFEISQNALLLRPQISRVPLAEIPEGLRPTSVELASAFPWLKANSDRSPMSAATVQGFSQEQLGVQVNNLFARGSQALAGRATPEQRVKYARALFEGLPHQGTGWLQQTKADQMIDSVLGLRSEEVTRKLQSLSEDQIKQKYGKEQTWFRYGNRNLLTPYFEFQNIMEFVKPQPGQTFVDIGSGMGRMGIYMGIMHPEVKSIGYELVTERVQEAKRAAQNLGLGANVHFHEQNLADATFKPEAADIYYAFNPVSGPTFDKIISDLKAQAIKHNKPFKFVVTGPAQYEKLEAQSEWLKEITPARQFADDDFARVFSFVP